MTLHGTRVLVVEDDALISMMIEDFLLDLGCEVVASAAGLEEGVHQASTLAIDVAMLDINLDGRLSYPIADVLRARKIPFLFATGYGPAALPPSFQGAPVLSKPFGIAQLKEELGRVLDRCMQ